MASRSFPVVDGNNIIIHNKERVEVPVLFYDHLGAEVNMTGKQVFFETSMGLRKSLTPGLNPFQMVLVLDRGELETHKGKLVTYTIIDETANIYQLMADGQIIVRGW